MRESPKQTHLGPALTVSVIVHAGLLATLISSQVARKETANHDSAPPLVVSIANTNPQRATRKSVATVSGEGDTGTPTQQQLAPSPSLVSATPPSVAPATADSGVTPATDAVPFRSGENFDAVALQQSIVDYGSSVKSDRLQQWLQECQRYRNRYEQSNCPLGEEAKTAKQEAIDKSLDETFIAWVNGYDRNRRLSADLVKQGERLHAMAAQGGVLGELARERYSSQKSLFSRLSPDSEALRQSRDPILQILPFPSKRGLTFFGGLFTLGYNGNVTMDDEQARGPALLINATRFKPHSEESTSTPEFRKIPSLFESADD